MSYEDTGKKIKARRKELNISAAILAERIGLSKATIHRYENGDIKNIKMPVLESMAETLKVNPMWLIGKSENKDGNGACDVSAALDDLLSDLTACEVVLYNDKPLSPKGKEKLILALQILRNTL